MRDIKYWKKELCTMHPSEYIDFLQAIKDYQYRRWGEEIRTRMRNEKTNKR